MPLATTKEVRDFTRNFGPIRLTCQFCDAAEDGIRLIPHEWTDVGREQSLRDAISWYDDTDDDPEPKGYASFRWWTHMGICPDCQDEK